MQRLDPIIIGINFKIMSLKIAMQQFSDNFALRFFDFDAKIFDSVSFAYNNTTAFNRERISHFWRRNFHILGCKKFKCINLSVCVSGLFYAFSLL